MIFLTKGWIARSLDHSIRFWREERRAALGSYSGGPPDVVAVTRAECYIDAYQSARVNLLGEQLPLEAGRK